MRVIGLAGWSGAGKTTVVTALIGELRRRGHAVSTVKHAHHKFDIDKPGKDSYEHRAAGAEEVLVGSSQRWALIRELRGAREPSMPELLRRLSPVDFVLVEGFKWDAFPKIEVHRAANDKAPLYPQTPGIRAIASDVYFSDTDLPQVALHDIAAIADLVEAHAVPVEGLTGAAGGAVAD
ncbi:MAG: molybdopterin-guanine dinucleotide biosynthesis protein B [Alphaproteobacteria bacterium]